MDTGRRMIGIGWWFAWGGVVDRQGGGSCEWEGRHMCCLSQNFAVVSEPALGRSGVDATGGASVPALRPLI